MHLDPVAAYDRIAPRFARLSYLRRPYLDQVERVVIDSLPPEARSLLDVGAGDGSRSLRIARQCRIARLVLLEPSAAMRGPVLPGIVTWAMRAEELSRVQEQFDAITCLWNVLGHISARGDVLRHFARLLNAGGLLFVDVSHRYNAREYGVARTLLRCLHDCIRPDERNGDVVVNWDTCSTTGHVFTDREFRALAEAAGLAIRRRVAIDYTSGKIQRSLYMGHLLYIMERKAAATSSISSSRS